MNKSTHPRAGWRRSAWIVSALAIAMSFLHAEATWGQDVTEPSLKAAFIYNFAKFTDWPADVLPRNAPFVACVLGDLPVGEALAKAVKGRQLGGRPINVSSMQADGTLRSCHLLYVSGLPAPQVTAILVTLRAVPILTISDMEDFMRMGGVAHMFVEGGKMRFDLNRGNARRSRIELSSRLLALAAHVYDTVAGGSR
jgi:hypothetical protein